MEGYLRQFQHDALERHAYDTAIFIGDKLLAITGMTLYSYEQLSYRVY